MPSQLLHIRPHGDIFEVVFLFDGPVEIVLQRPPDELRRILTGGGRLVVLIFKHPPAQGELPEDLCHHIPLLLGGGEASTLTDTLHSFTGGDVTDIVFPMDRMKRCAAFNMRAFKDNTGHPLLDSILPFYGIL